MGTNIYSYVFNASTISESVKYDLAQPECCMYVLYDLPIKRAPIHYSVSDVFVFITVVLYGLCTKFVCFGGSLLITISKQNCCQLLFVRLASWIAYGLFVLLSMWMFESLGCFFLLEKTAIVLLMSFETISAWFITIYMAIV